MAPPHVLTYGVHKNNLTGLTKKREINPLWKHSKIRQPNQRPETESSLTLILGPNDYRSILKAIKKLMPLVLIAEAHDAVRNFWIW